ncbi:MAG: hypothetical protein ACKVJC_04760 [Flavobacteriales bacterium]|jgi:hypothetical protein
MKKNVLTIVLLIGLFALGSLIINYYWTNNTLSSIVFVPMYVVVMTFFYIILQIAKRYFISNKNWWDWLYYLGLIGVLLPLYFAKEENLDTFQWVSDCGVSFLIVPLLFDIKELIISNKTRYEEN